MRGFTKLRPHLPFLFIFILSGTIYFTLLLTSQSHVDGDEGVIGIMARHIITRGELPIFFYGQHFGGGGAIESYLAVLPFAVFGESGISLKLVALIMALAVLLLTYLFCLRYINKFTAVAATAILATATPLIEWHTKMRGGYAALPLFYMVILLIYAWIAYRREHRWHYFFLLGLLCGGAYYNKALILPLLIALFLTTFCWKRIFWRIKSIVLFIAGFLTGVSPLIYYNLTHNFRNLRYTLYISSGGEKPWLDKAVGLISKYLPGFFIERNVDRFVPSLPLRSWVEYSIYAGLFLYMLFSCRSSLKAIMRAWLPGNFWGRRLKPPQAEGILLFYLIIFLLLQTRSRAISFSPRYLLPLFPALAIVSGAAIGRLWHSNANFIRTIGMIALSVLIILGLGNHIFHIGPSTVTDDVLLPEGRIANLQTSGRAAEVIINYLKQHKVYYAHCSYFLQWRILFESRETVIASSQEFAVGPSRYPAYDRQVRKAETFALIFHKDSVQYQQFSRAIYAKRMIPKRIHEYVVYLPGSIAQSGFNTSPVRNNKD